MLGYRIPAGALVGATPAISNRIAADFPDPDAFAPERYAEPRQEDLINRWTWIPFGAGRHRCVGANFAMIQLKAIFSVLLRDWTFELAQPPGHLPQRPLQDGGPARPPVRGPLPPPGATRRRSA